MRIFTTVLFLAPLSIATVALQAEVPVVTNVNPVADNSIREQVARNLAAIGLRGADIVITVQNGVVTLTGNVPTSRLRQKAGKVSNHIQGVTSVMNRLTVQKEVSPLPR